MSLIKFPSHIKPSRVTVQLQRVDETIVSPLSNIQQVVSRGNPAWRWTYEYTNLSESEREVVQAFLLNCRGSLNTFKVTDPSNYSLRGNLSDWTDIFSGYGSFNVVVGSDDNNNKVNSWFSRGISAISHITDEQTLRMQWRDPTQQIGLRWFGHGTAGKVNSFDIGAAYLHRIKYLHGNHPNAVSMAVGSTGDWYFIQDAPATRVYSSGMVSAPFVAFSNSHNVGLLETPQTEANNDTYWEYADYRLSRCALTVNTENLIIGNHFDHANWTQQNVSVQSGFTGDPLGGSNLWRLYVNSDEANSTHFLWQTGLTKIATEDLFSASIHARYPAQNLQCLRLVLADAAGNDAWADYDISVNSVYSTTLSGFRKAFGKIWVCPTSDFIRLQFTAQANNASVLRFYLYAINSQGGGTTFATTDTSYIEIAGVQVVKFPFMKPYFDTTSTNQEFVGSGDMTGSRLMVEGFDANDVIKAGTHFELITRYYNVDSGDYELSEFKRITRETRASWDGHATIEFDPPIRNALRQIPSRASGQGENETLHNAVVFHEPEMKARLLNGTVQYIEKPLQMTDVVFDVLEDLTE